MQVWTGQGKRKVLFIAPPGHAKSTWISIIGTTWYLGQHPDHSLLFLTSSDNMAGQFNGVVKASLEASAKHQLVFPDGAARPNEGRGWSSDGLYLTGIPASVKDPSYRAVGWGKSVIGSRVHGIIIDDPLTQEDAMSATVVDKAKMYLDMTLRSRLHPGGWVVAIMTRWSELDMAAHIMGQGDEWEVLNLPAIAEYPWGTCLWPERFPLATLEAERRRIGSAIFNCVWNGNPTGLGGDIFKEAAWFRPLPTDFEDWRSKTARVQYWDLAWSENKAADDTAATTISVVPDDVERRCYVTGLFHAKRDEDGLPALLADHILATRPHLVGIEEGAFKQATTRNLVAEVYRILAGRFAVPVYPVRVTTDKIFRARLPAARAEYGMMYVDKGLPSWPMFEAQCLGFPRASHDDFVDALSGATQLAVETPIQTGTRKVKFG